MRAVAAGAEGLQARDVCVRVGLGSPLFLSLSLSLSLSPSFRLPGHRRTGEREKRRMQGRERMEEETAGENPGRETGERRSFGKG